MCAGAPSGRGSDAAQQRRLAMRAAKILRGAKQLAKQRNKEVMVRARANRSCPTWLLVQADLQRIL